MTNTNLLGAYGGQAGDALMFRNRVLNGDMRIDQRNAGASVAFGPDIFSVDRWKVEGSANSKMTAQQSSVAPAGFTNSVLLTTTAAYAVTAGDFFGIFQAIEGFNVADLAWGTANAQSISISFWVRSSLTGTFGGAIENAANNRSYPFSYSISVANTWEQKTVTIPGDTTGTWLTNNGRGLVLRFGVGVGSTYSGPAGAWSSTRYFAPTGATSVVGTNGATLYITGVQLEAGPTATPFERRPYSVELDLCERYYREIDVNGTTVNIYPGTPNGYFNVSHKEMRSIPVPTFDTTYTNSGNIYFNSTSVAATYAVNAPATKTGQSIRAVRTTGTFAAGEVCGHTYLRLKLSAEL